MTMRDLYNKIYFQRKIFHRQITDVAEHLKPVEEAIDFLEIYLSDTKFVACDEVSIIFKIVDGIL